MEPFRQKGSSMDFIMKYMNVSRCSFIIPNVLINANKLNLIGKTKSENKPYYITQSCFILKYIFDI